MRHSVLLLIAVTGLAACEGGLPMSFNAAPDEISRPFSAAFRDQPFDTGPVTVMTRENGNLMSYVFELCGPDAVCSGARRGKLEQQPDHIVITGTHAGRAFHLSSGGDGYMQWRGVQTPLAWGDPKPATVLAPTRFTDAEIRNKTPG